MMDRSLPPLCSCSLTTPLTQVVSLILGINQLHCNALLTLVHKAGPICSQVNNDCSCHHWMGKISLLEHYKKNINSKPQPTYIVDPRLTPLQCKPTDPSTTKPQYMCSCLQLCDSRIPLAALGSHNCIIYCKQGSLLSAAWPQV